MMFSALLPLVVLIGVVVALVGVGAARHRSTGIAIQPATPDAKLDRPVVAGTRPQPQPQPQARRHGPRAIDPRLGIQLDHWVAAGLLTADQSDAITAYEDTHMRTPSPTITPAVIAASSVVPSATTRAPALAVGRRIPVMAEALGYIGGILGTVGLVLLVSRYWDDIATGARLGLAGGAALGLVLAGMVVREATDPALARLRWTLWLASTVATGLFALVLGDKALGLEPDERVALVVAAAVTVQSGLLWWNHPRPVQQLTMLGGLGVTTALLVGEFAGDIVTGAAVGAVGVAVLVLGLRHLTPMPVITIAAGAITTIAGTIVIATAREGVGFPLASLATASLVALAVAPGSARGAGERATLAVIGAFGMLQVMPQTIVWFARDAGVATGVVVWAIGGALIAVAIARHVHAAIAIEVLGGVAMIGGAAITGTGSVGFATVFGIVTAVGFVVVGMLPGRVLMSLFGSAGLLVFVPWTIAHFFPGEDRAPLLILVSGALLVAIAVLLTRQGKRFRRELGPTAAVDRRAETASSSHVSSSHVSPARSDAGAVDVDPEVHPAEGLVETR